MTETFLEAVALARLLDNKRIRGLTHGYFSYPARTTPTIPREVVGRLSPSRGLVVDPFCGGGTVIVESIIQGRYAIGNDLNPLGVYITRMKTNALNPERLSRDVAVVKAELGRSAGGNDELVRNLFEERELRVLPKRIVRDIVTIKTAIESSQIDLENKSLVGLALAATCTSLQDRRSLGSIRLIDFFLRRLAEIEQGNRSLHEMIGEDQRAIIFNLDASKLTEVIPSVCPRADLILCSPPYRGLHVEYLEIMLAGRIRSVLVPRLLDLPIQKRNFIVTDASYFNKTEEFAMAFGRILKSRCYACIVVGFKSKEDRVSFASIFRRNGFELTKRYERPLGSTYEGRRMWFPFVSSKTRRMNSESIFFFRKTN